jgi:hypothetical protein
MKEQTAKYAIDGATLSRITQYEQDNYFVESNRFNSIVLLLKEEGVDVTDISLHAIIASGTKSPTLEIAYAPKDGEVVSIILPVTETNDTATHWILCVSMSPALNALPDSPFPLIYLASNLIGNRIVVTEPDTHPLYVSEIMPKHMHNEEYGTEDAQTTAMRFTRVGEQKTKESVLATPVIVRYMVEATEECMNNGFGEIYPVVMHGNFVQFNAIIQYYHTLTIPVSENTYIQPYKDAGACMVDSVSVALENTKYWLNTTNGNVV